jgi:cell division protein ZapE
MPTAIFRHYQNLLESGTINSDKEQLLVIGELSALGKRITDKYNAPAFLKILQIVVQKNTSLGMYIYGSMGTGKSMMMDLFYNNIDIKQKKRVHFHNFMIDLHKRLHEIRKTAQKIDVIIELARQISEETKLLCFDELHITEVTDAMILSRLFTELFKNNVFIVVTSNRSPEDLYRHSYGLEHFSKFVNILNQNLEILKLNSMHDYRQAKIKSMKQVYFTPNSNETRQKLSDIFADLCGKEKPYRVSLRVGNRIIDFHHCYKTVLLDSFHHLCTENMWTQEYMAIANSFNCIIMLDIPKLNNSNRNEAKRFLALIDILYENKIFLICGAEVEPDELYTTGDEAFEFKRAISRLKEMQSEEYLNKYGKF